MMSKILFIKLVKEDVRKRSALFAVFIVVFFVVIPLAFFINLDNEIAMMKQGLESLSNVKNTYRNMVGTKNYIIEIATIAMSVATGISGFTYLHSKVKVDFYHSLPLKRGQWFWISYVSGIIMYLFSAAFCTIICLLLGVTNNILTGEVLVLALQIFLFRFLEFLAAYGATILITVITGNIIVSVFGTIIFACYMPLWGLLVNELSRLYFSSYVIRSGFTKYATLLSPILNMLLLEEKMKNLEHRKWVIVGYFIIIFWIVITTGTAYWLNKIRKSEMAESAIVFSKLKGIIKILTVVPSSIAAGIILSSMITRHSIFWFFGGIVFACVLLSAVIEFVYSANMKEIFLHKRQIFVSLFLSVCVYSIYQWDFIGYDTYIPNKEEIQQMAVFDSSLNGAFLYDYDAKKEDELAEVRSLRNTLTSNFDAIYEAAKEGALHKNYGDDVDTKQIYIEYKLKSGKQIIRIYNMPKSCVNQMYTKLFQHDEYKRIIYPLLTRDNEIISSVSLSNIRNSYTRLEMSKEQRQKLLQVYKEELQKTDYNEVTNDVVGTLSIEIKNDNSGKENSSIYEFDYPIGKHFENTIAMLRQCLGGTFNDRIKEEEVKEIVVTDYRNGETKEYRFSYKENMKEIKEIIKTLKYYPTSDERWEGNEIYCEVILKDGTNVEYGLYFDEEQLPSCIEELGN